MIASMLIIAFSLVLFVYWFRYSCLLLLRRTPEQSAAVADRFHFVAVRQGLQDAVALDPLHQALDRDYRVLTYLLDHAAGLELEKLEYRLLALDYRMMQLWYRITRWVVPSQARRALGEMADVLDVLVGRMGENASVRTEV